MSSLRNAVKRITHKERSQLRKRQHLGILEKKKDYKQRAVDYHEKEDRIKAMKKRANMRNPDEFYFGMHNSQVKEGKHRTTTDYRDVPPEMIQLMKDQDLSYVRMQKQKDAKRAERLQASLHFLGGDEVVAEEMNKKAKRRKHTVFVDNQEAADTFDVVEHFDTIPEMAGRTFNRLRKQDVEKLARKMYGGDDGDGVDDEYQPTSEDVQKEARLHRKLARKLAKARASAYGEMEARNKRAKALQIAEDHLMTEKNVSSKGRKRKIKAAEDGRPAQYKWRRKRLG